MAFNEGLSNRTAGNNPGILTTRSKLDKKVLDSSIGNNWEGGKIAMNIFNQKETIFCT